MTMTEITDALISWTPYLATGFGWNMIIALTAMGIGTPIGLILAAMRASSMQTLIRSGNWVTMFARSAPTFVMLFYITYTVPTTFELFGLEITISAWLKASIALAIAVAGYVSDNALASLRHLRQGETAAALLFLPSWTNYFLIIIMASATASVVGVPELVHRAGTVIGAIGGTDLTFWVYLYAMAWFLVFSAAVSLPMRFLRTRLSRHS